MRTRIALVALTVTGLFLAAAHMAHATLIAYAHNGDIYVVDEAGGAPTNRTNGVGTNSDPDWSPDGTKIAFVSDRTGSLGGGDVHVMDSDGANVINVTQSDLGIAEFPSWGSTGTIAFGMNGDIWQVDETGGVPSALSPADGLGGYFPEWKPDGTKIAFRRTGTNPGIWHMDSDGANPAQLFTVESGSTFPSYSQDGLFVVHGNSGDLRMTDADGSNVVHLVGGSTQRHPSFSPDGLWVVFDSTRPGAVAGNSLWKVLIADGTLVDMEIAADPGYPDWQPDPPIVGIDVTPTSLDFQSVEIGQPATRTFDITSTGTETLTVSDIVSDDAAFTITTTPAPPFSLAAATPELSQTVTVTFTPTAAGGQTANITITHNAAGSPTVVTATGTGTATPPTITITAPTAGQELPAGTTDTPITVAITDHLVPGHWHWRLDTPFADTGTAGGTAVPAGTLTGTITGLTDDTSYTVYVALVVDGTHALVDVTTNAASRASVAFSVAAGEAATDTVTVVDAQGSAGADVTVPIDIDISDALAAGDSITGIDLTVTYGPAILTPASNAGDIVAAAVTDLTTGWSIAQNVVTPGELEIVMAADFADKLLAGGTLIKLSFGVDASAITNTTTPVGLSRALLNEGLVPSTGVTGTFTVVNFKYGDVTGNGTWSGYDASHVLEHVSRELADGSHHEFPVEATAPVWAPLPLTHAEAETVANVGGETKPDPDGGPDPVPDITAMDASLILQRAVSIITIFPVESPAAPAAVPMVVTAPLKATSTSARPGARVSVILDISAMPNLRAGELVLEFDRTLLTPVGVSLRPGSAAGETQAPLLMQREGDGRLAVAFASARPIGGPDAMLEVTFEAARNVVQPRESEIRASHLRLNASRIATDFVFPFRVEPFQTRLMANYPNPFNPETWIPFELASDSDVTVRIYGLDGEIVRTLDLGYRPVGEYRARESAAYWDGRNETGERVASGLYVYELIAGDQRAVRRMVISK